jgi:ribosomal protein L7/L12
MNSKHNIPPAAMELAARGHLIEAVKVTREQTGLSLVDAKNAVDAYVRNPNGGSRFSQPRVSLSSNEIPPKAIRSLHDGRFIDAVKHTREARGLGLKAAKETVEEFLKQHPDTNAKFKAATAVDFKRVVGKLATVFSSRLAIRSSSVNGTKRISASAPTGQ